MNTQITRFTIPEMTCGSCGHHVRAALAELEGIQKVEIRLSARQASILHDLEDAPVAKLIEALRVAGYEVTESSSEGALQQAG